MKILLLHSTAWIQGAPLISRTVLQHVVHFIQQIIKGQILNALFSILFFFFWSTDKQNQPKIPTFWHVLWGFIVEVCGEVRPFTETVTSNWEDWLQQNKASFKIVPYGIFCYSWESTWGNKRGLYFTQNHYFSRQSWTEITQRTIPDLLSAFPVVRTLSPTFMHRWAPGPDILLIKHFLRDLFVKFHLWDLSVLLLWTRTLQQTPEVSVTTYFLM